MSEHGSQQDQRGSLLATAEDCERPQLFFGFATSYWRFRGNFSSIAAALSDLIDQRPKPCLDRSLPYVIPAPQGTVQFSAHTLPASEVRVGLFFLNGLVLRPSSNLAHITLQNNP
ncbi:hypothetical protein DPEC_G00098610 [Dallia pectoralis]|uniref:Uncharacterized protein n=1 Tax=Dallia pectoralis TaxID=75939 RepID=A0ACC2GVW5_DALPE|nr:hypothetical protein DPEC_G00098610 [Dallia pectoralis]